MNSISIIITGFTIFLPLLINSVVIDLPNCGPKFYCPDQCNISYVNDCPHNCNCKPIRFCPEAKCPLPGPGCIVVTKVDGCQTCVCHQPVILIKSTTPDFEDTDFLFFNKTEFALVSKTYRKEGNQNTLGDSSESSETNTFEVCSPDDKDQVDQCLFKTLNYRSFVKRRRDDAVPSVNPLVQLYRKELDRICELYNDGLSCLGRDIYDRCRLSHFELATIDAFLGYSCGPKQTKFAQHYQCVQDVHKLSVRLQLCEDLLTASMLQLAESRLAIQEKQKRKCRAIQWFVQCERPDIYRHCSPEAADVYIESLKSAAEYIVPGCDPSFSHSVFAGRYISIQDLLISENELGGFHNNTSFNSTLNNNDTAEELKVNITSDLLVDTSELQIESQLFNNLNLSIDIKPIDKEFFVTNETAELQVEMKSPKLYRRPPDLAKNFKSLVTRLKDAPLKEGEESLEDTTVENNNNIEYDLEFENDTSTISNISFSVEIDYDNESQSIIDEVGFTDHNINIATSTTMTEHIPRELHYVNETLAEKEQVTCKTEYQKSIDENFKLLFTEIRSKIKSANLAFPLAYSYQKATITEKCRQYRKASTKISSEAKRTCVSNYEIYDQVFNVYEYACGYGTQSYFLYYFDCIADARKDPYVKACEYEADEYLKDPSVNTCQPYGLFSDCIYDDIVRRCGRDAWEITYQFLSFYVKKHVENCDLPRIYRPVEKVVS